MKLLRFDNSDSGWQTQRWKQDLLERASISIARGNYNMLRNNRTLPAG